MSLMIKDREEYLAMTEVDNSIYAEKCFKCLTHDNLTESEGWIVCEDCKHTIKPSFEDSFLSGLFLGIFYKSLKN